MDRSPPFWYPPILTYHRIHPDSNPDTPTLSPAVFERQMKILAQDWNLLPLSDLVTVLEGRGALPARSVVVTFDDGTDDTFSYAFPILSRYRIPATVFMIAHHVDKPGSLRKEEILRMSEEGISFGSHTLSHAYLPSLEEEEVARQLHDSKRILENLGLRVEHLSYPGGGFTPEISKKAREAGYRSACTTNRGVYRFPIERWALRRITVHGAATSRWGMWFRCCGYYGLNRRLRLPA